MFGLMAPGACFVVFEALQGPQTIMEHCLVAPLGQMDVILAALPGLLDPLDEDLII